MKKYASHKPHAPINVPLFRLVVTTNRYCPTKKPRSFMP